MIVFEASILTPTTDLQFVLQGVSKSLGYIHISAEKFRKESSFDSSNIVVDNCIVRPPDPGVLISPIGCTTILVRGEIVIAPKTYHLAEQNTKIGNIPTKIASGDCQLSTDQMCVWMTRYLHEFCVEHLESSNQDFTYLLVGCFNGNTSELIMCKYDAREFGSERYNLAICYQDRYDLLECVSKKQQDAMGNPHNILNYYMHNRSKDGWKDVVPMNQFNNVGLFSVRELKDLQMKWDTFNWKEETSEKKERESNEHSDSQA